MKPDLIVVWPNAFRYPLYEQWLLTHSDYFNKIIVRFTQCNLPYDRSDEVNTILSVIGRKAVISWEPRNTTGDWRDSATRKALVHSTSDWVLFMEQDFIVHRDTLLQHLLNRAATGYYNQSYGFKEGDRIHPGFLLVSRLTLDLIAERGSLDFSPIPDVSDHFSRVTRCLETTSPSAKFIPLEDLGFTRPDDYDHMNGLTHNLSLYMGGFAPVSNPDGFFEYLTKCKEVDPNAYALQLLG